MRHGLEKVIPVDIERLVDNVLKINIIPFPSLYRSFEIDAFISNDFRKIYIDEYLYVNLDASTGLRWRMNWGIWFYTTSIISNSR